MTKAGALDRIRKDNAVSSAVRSWTESLGLLREFSELMERHLGVSLPVSLEVGPEDLEAVVKSGKEFSTALLEGRPHPWRNPLRFLPSGPRMTVEGSLFLWRKTLPVLRSPTPSEHRERVTAAEVELPAGYLPFLFKLAQEEFPVGWDSGYHGYVERDVPTVKSVTGRKRKDGGWRSTGPSREEHGLKTLGYSPVESECIVDFLVAPCDGKERAVTVMSSSDQVLKPLHKALYGQLSKRPWLLRGEASASEFKKAGLFRRKGEVFVSGDYESATDHLPVTAAEMLLRGARKNSRYIPDSIWELAFRFLRVRIKYPDLPEPVQTTRQLMGSLLCFPLLCLQNYAAFRWIFGPQVPVKINGDDIVFRSTRASFDKWADFVGSVGLRLSRGKTMVHNQFFSLNSHFFRARYTNINLVPVVRFTSLTSQKCKFPNGLSGAFRGFLKGFDDEFKESLGTWWLKKKSRLIRRSGRSVVRGLKIPATESMLKGSDLWYREIWYLNSVPTDRFGQEARLPAPPTKLEGQVVIPSGWRRCPRKGVSAVRQAEEEEFFEILTSKAWDCPGSSDTITLEKEYFAELSMSGFEASWTRWRSRRPFRGIRRGAVKSRLKSAPFYSLVIPPFVNTVWLKETVKDLEGPATTRTLLEALPFAVDHLELDPVCSARSLISPIRFEFGGHSSDFKFNGSANEYRWTDSVPKPWSIKFVRTEFARAGAQWRALDFEELDKVLGPEPFDPYLPNVFIPPPPCLW